MASSRQLKTKIRAVRNIRQITRAMQMVAATKMRRSQETALRARPYAKKALALLLHLLEYTKAEDVAAPFMDITKARTVPASGRIALVVVTSDKGLAGSFNSAVLRLASRFEQEEEQQGKTVEVVAIGRKGRDFFRKRGVAITAEFFRFSDIVTLPEIEPVMEWILRAYQEQRYEKIAFCSQQFISALLQKPEIHQVLPLERAELEKIIDAIIPKTGRYADWTQRYEKLEAEVRPNVAYVLEPSARQILEQVVRDLIRLMVVHLIFESNASEHSARMIAMKNATENADRIQEELTLELNKTRQAAITQELAEVTIAKEALAAEYI